MKFYITEPVTYPRYIYIDIPAKTEEEAIKIIENCNDPEELIDKYMDYSEVNMYDIADNNITTIHSEQTGELVKTYSF